MGEPGEGEQRKTICLHLFPLSRILRNEYARADVKQLVLELPWPSW